MRILHLVCVSPPDVGGMGAVAAHEVAMLRECTIDAGIISLTTHALIRIGNVGLIRSLDRLVRSADIVHLHYPFYGVAGRVAALKRKGHIKKLIMTLHMDATAPGWKGKIFDLHRKWWQSEIVDTADALIVSSRDYAEHSSFRTIASRVIEIPFGVNETTFIPGSVASDRFGIPSDANVVLFVGGMDTAHAFKGVDVLLRSLARLPATAWGVFVGDGNLRSQYEKVANELGLQRRVRFLGRVSEMDLPDVYRLAKVVACPSISGAEAFGLVAVEAMACGIPVVASALPGVRTVVDNEVTGYVIPPKDVFALTARLQCLLEHPELRTRLGRAGRERVLARYTWGRHMDGLLSVYERVCGSPL